MFNKIKIKNMSDMLKLDFGNDDYQTVDLAGNHGLSSIKISNDTRPSNSPGLFRPRPNPNLDTVHNKDSDLGFHLLMNKDVNRKSTSSPVRGMSPPSLNLGSSPIPSAPSGGGLSFMGGNERNVDFSSDVSPQKVDFTPGKLNLDNDLDFEINDPVFKPDFNILGDEQQKQESGGGLFSSFDSKPASGTFDSDPVSVDQPVRLTFEQQQQEKANMLRKLDRLRKKGYFVYKNLSLDSEYEEIKSEYENVKEEASLQRSLRQQKDILITTSRVIEGAAGTELVQEYTGKLELEGWSQHMMETVDDYEDIMEDLHDKYGKMFNDGAYPEARLLFAVIHSAIMFHITKKYVQQMPNLGALLNQNPNLAREFSRATANFVGQQSPAFAGMVNDMNMANEPQQPNLTSMEPRDMQVPRDLENILNRLNTDSGMADPTMGGGININL
jgi:hypothetical protein